MPVYYSFPVHPPLCDDETIHIMMTYSLFPDLFFLSIIAVAIIRITLGTYFVFLGLRLIAAIRGQQTISTTMLVASYLYALIQICVGGLLFVGWYTQAAALVAMAIAFLGVEAQFSSNKPRGERPMYILLFILSFCLLFLGPGAFAIDIPL
jgi:uncharacterized membrane protein YphA (DoxX/SURF4 family)